MAAPLEIVSHPKALQSTATSSNNSQPPGPGETIPEDSSKDEYG